jgi:type II secretory pathway component PulF
LPELYVHLLEVGVRGNDLPGVLTLLADYYQRLNALWTRLTGLMVYPLLVLGLALTLSMGLFLVYRSLLRTLVSSDQPFGFSLPSFTGPLLFIPPVLIALVFVSVLLALTWPRLRRYLQWRLPGFREASLSLLASGMNLMLKQGGNLNEALSLMRQLEQHSPAGIELAQWQSRLASGRGTFKTIAQAGTIIPPLFIWLVANSGEDLAAGFRQAAEIYYNRAVHKIDILLYAVLPVSILVLGFVILGQMFPFIRVITITMNSLGSME